MNKESLIFEVSHANFDKYVLQNSHKVPVLVEFMAVWSAPCSVMESVLTSFANEFPEQFIFAKVDIDEQPDLRKRFKIENVPTLLVFNKGELVKTEVGELNEDEIREVLKEFGIFKQSESMREQAREKHLQGDTSAAIVLLTEAIKIDPANLRVAMDMIQIFIDIGELEQANSLFERLPNAVREMKFGKVLSDRIMFANRASQLDSIEQLDEQLATNPADSKSMFDRSIHHIASYHYEQGIEMLLNICQNDSGFQDGAAKDMLIRLSDMLAAVNSELSKEIKRKLASLLT